jgi:hypothetical protein
VPRPSSTIKVPDKSSVPSVNRPKSLSDATSRPTSISTPIGNTGKNFEISGSGAGVRFNNNLRVGVQTVTNPNRTVVEKRGDMRIVRPESATGIGFQYSW